MNDDDIDDDGYLTYPEYIIARRRAEAQEEMEDSSSSSSSSHSSDSHHHWQDRSSFYSDQVTDSTIRPGTYFYSSRATFLT